MKLKRLSDKKRTQFLRSFLVVGEKMDTLGGIIR